MWDKREPFIQGTEKDRQACLRMVVCIIERNVCLKINQADSVSEKGRVLSQGTEERRSLAN